MPSAMNANRTVQSASPDVGSAPGLMGNFAFGGQSDVLKQVLCVIDKKVRNMEKKKSKLDDYQVRKDKGERLNQDQLEALSKYQEVMNNLEFARELQKTFIALGQDIQKAVKKTVRREQLQRDEAEQRRLKTVLELQFLLDRLGDDAVRQDLKQGLGGSPLLTDADLTALDEFYKLVGPERDQNIRLVDQYEEASIHLWDLLEGRDKAVFVNRQFIPDGTYSSSEKEQGDEWTTETEQPLQPTPPPVPLETHPLNLASPAPPTDPMVRKQVVQDLMAQMQGTYNFMQDSMLEFDGQPIDPAIVSAQPMKPAQNMDLPQMVCPPEQPPPSTTLPPASQTQVFQPVTKSPHSSGINVNAAPFQSMQTVFNLNAPVPPANETEALNQANQYQNSYNQAFSSQTQHPVEQTEMQSEQLQSVVGAFHSQDQSGGHQQPSQQGPGFGRQAQSFYNSRGMSRGGPRNARGMINGYRGASNGFRGGYDGYRPPFANTPNSGYGQTQFNTPRDYSNGNYQRDGYQQNYKRGAGQGPRGVSRGSTQAMRS
uniref:Cell cycle associated protein 1b n=1 Tax=Sphaeramia orbicularis TaxID=375764 RepID=A0A672ZU51_9TELE